MYNSEIFCTFASDKCLHKKLINNTVEKMDCSTNIECQLEVFGNGQSIPLDNDRIVYTIKEAEQEIFELDESIDSLKLLKPNCDKIDYALAASSGCLCGIIDVFLVGKPGESPLEEITDKWFDKKVSLFAKICGWKGPKKATVDPVKSAIGFLERKFKVPYDQRGAGDAGKIIFGLTAKSHHFKSLAHNPTLLGLFFSILDQFTLSSHFINEGQLIELVDVGGTFELKGNNFPAKIWCGFVNWFGHRMSDVAGSSGSKSRGMGIPSPIWSWTNNIIAIKAKLNIPVSEFDKNFNELGAELFNKGFDARFQTTQAIPVFINSLLVRLMYSVRRFIQYYNDTNEKERSFRKMWDTIKPFSNPSVERMLLVAHGAFCLIDGSDATIRSFVAGGGTFNPVEFFLRLNVIGIGRFSISLYGEAKRAIHYHQAEQDAIFEQNRKLILVNFVKELEKLSQFYDDAEDYTWIIDFNNGNLESALKKSARLAVRRGCAEDKTLMSKKKIDDFFTNRK